MNKNLVFIGILGSFIVTGCAGFGALSSPETDDSDTDKYEIPLIREANPLSQENKQLADLFYHVLTGEVAARQRAMDIAVEHYHSAAKMTNDPRVSERATQMALFHMDPEIALSTARTWVGNDPNSLDARSTLAQLLIRQGHLELALDQMQRVLMLAGSESRQRFSLVARVLFQAKEPDRVLTVMEGLVQRYPDDPWAHLAYAQLASESGKNELVRQEAQTALRLKLEMPEASVLLAESLIKLGQREEGLSILEKVVESDPDNRNLRVSYARLLTEAGHFEQAKNHFQILLEKNPGDGDIRFALGVICVEQDQWQEAKQHFEHLVKAEQHLNEAYFYLGSIADQEKQWEQALVYYQEVSEGELAINAHIRIAQILAKQGDIAEAQRFLWDITPLNDELMVQLSIAEAEILSEAERAEAAMLVLDKALQQEVDDPSLLYARAIIAEKLNRLDILEEDLKKVLEADPGNAHALNTLGYTLADRTDRFEEALDYIHRALELLPNEAAIIDSMGWVQYRLGNLEDALRYLDRAYSLDRDPEIAAHLGEVLWNLGKKDQAQEIWIQALERDPNSEKLKEMLDQFIK